MQGYNVSPVMLSEVKGGVAYLDEAPAKFVPAPISAIQAALQHRPAGRLQFWILRKVI